MMFKRAEQMEVAWSKVGAIRRMLEDFTLLLLHDNACPHTANKPNEMLRNFKWEVYDPNFIKITVGEVESSVDFTWNDLMRVQVVDICVE
jgi:hypothetical protein